METGDEMVRTILGKALEDGKSASRYFNQTRFARELGISPNSLSRILRGRIVVGKRMGMKLLQKIASSDQLVLAENAFNQQTRQSSFTQEQLEGSLNQDATMEEMFVDPTYFLLITMSALAGAKPEAAWYADQLGISPKEVEAKFRLLLEKRVINYNPLEKNRTSAYVKMTLNFSKVLSQYRFRERQMRVLDLERRAFSELQTGEYAALDLFFNASEKDLPIIRAMMENLRHTLAMRPKSYLKEVYLFRGSVFPVRKKSISREH